MERPHNYYPPLHGGAQMTGDKEAAEAAYDKARQTWDINRTVTQRSMFYSGYDAGCAHVRAKMALGKSVREMALAYATSDAPMGEYDAFLAGYAQCQVTDKTDHRYHPAIDRIEELETQLKNLERAAEGLVNVVVTLTGFQRYSGFVAEEVYTLAQAAREALAKWEMRSGN